MFAKGKRCVIICPEVLEEEQLGGLKDDISGSIGKCKKADGA